MISGTYLSIEVDQNRYLKAIYYDKVFHPSSSKIWKLSFYFLKNVQLIVLFLMFMIGLRTPNTLPHLAFMMFFVVFLTFERIYRKASIIMVVFMCSIILL